MKAALCPSCFSQTSFENTDEDCLALCACGAVLGAANDVVARPSDGLVVFDPGKNLSAPRRFTLDPCGAPVSPEGYRVAPPSAKERRVALSLPYAVPVQDVGAILLLGCLFALGGIAGLAVSIQNEWQLAWLLFAIGFGIPGLAALYVTLALFVARTRIAIHDGLLTVGHGPLPFARLKAISCSDVEQLLCYRYVRSSAGFDRRSGDVGMGYVTYSVCARLHGSGEELPLVSKLERPQEALFIAQSLQRALQLEPGGHALALSPPLADSPGVAPPAGEKHQPP